VIPNSSRRKEPAVQPGLHLSHYQQLCHFRALVSGSTGATGLPTDFIGASRYGMARIGQEPPKARIPNLTPGQNGIKTVFRTLSSSWTEGQTLKETPQNEFGFAKAPVIELTPKTAAKGN
jgi:hypothetical protein